MVQNKDQNFVSCVIYLHNEGSVIREFLDKICRVMEANFEKYEIICVDDGCVDDTVEQVKEYLRQTNKQPVVSLVTLSFYQGV